MFVIFPKDNGVPSGPDRLAIDPNVTPTDCPLKNCEYKGNSCCAGGRQWLLEEEQMLRKVLLDGKNQTGSNKT